MSIEKKLTPIPIDGHTNGHLRYAERESLEGGKEGFFGAYLDETFLPGYYNVLHRRMAQVGVENASHLKQISQVIDKLFVPIVSQKNAGRVKLTGEIPRSIAAGFPSEYWERFERLYEKQNQLKSSSHQLVREFCNSSLGFSKDPDVDITFFDLTVAQISRAFKALYGVKKEDIDRRSGREMYELYQENGLVVTVDTGPIPTKRDTKLMVIKVLDADTKEQIFHIDVGEFPKNVQAVVKDKRVVHATRKHGCQAELSVVDGHLYYSVPPKEVQLMNEPDTIYTRDLWSLYELATRSMRISCSHPDETLVDFEKFVPQLDRDTAFALQKIFRKGRHIRPEIPKEILFLAIKEMIVSFDYDHLQAAQMLLDTDISIPGLEELTPEHRNKILTSDSFSLELQDGNKVPPSDRDEAYLRRQRLLYVAGKDETGHKYHDGLTRFVSALRELDILPPAIEAQDDWEAFFELFAEKKPAQITIVESGAQITGPSGVIYVLSRIDKEPVTRIGVEELAENITYHLPNRAEGIDEMTNVILMMRERANGEMKKAINTYLRSKGKRKLSNIQKIQRSESKNLVYSVGNAFRLLDANRSGLTPLQMKTLYLRLRGRYRKRPFHEAFLELKRLGLVMKSELESITDRRHVRQPVDFYFIQPEGEAVHNLVELVSLIGIKSLLPFYRAQVKSAGLNGKSMDLEELINQLDKRGINLEVLESLTEFDYRELIKRRQLSVNLHINAECLREALRWYYAEKYIEDSAIPPALMLTLKSSHRKLVDRMRGSRNLN